MFCGRERATRSDEEETEKTSGNLGLDSRYHTEEKNTDERIRIPKAPIG